MKEAILHLGGHFNRIETTLKLAKEHPNALIVFSGEDYPEKIIEKLKENKIEKSRFILDYAAWDTLTNFTTTIDIFKQHQIDTIYLVTDQYHMPRAGAIGFFVYLFRGVKIIECQYNRDSDATESLNLVFTDILRALLWRFTGILLYWKEVKAQRMPTYISYAKKVPQLLSNY